MSFESCLHTSIISANIRLRLKFMKNKRNNSGNRQKIALGRAIYKTKFIFCNQFEPEPKEEGLNVA